ncbi:MAG: hypothetical protein M3198_06370 [Actinomycetota bacterium]|nr:hypothetical protein [Actinomycetota bacterium]
MQRAHTTTNHRSASRAGRFARVVAIGAGVMLVAFGAWAFFSPRSFFDTVATFEPYNRHFIHDIGSFQIGLGAVLLLSAYLRDALLVALSGVAVGSVFHFVSHLIDRDIGGKPASDLPLFAVLALVLVAAAFSRRSQDNGGSGERS